MSNKKTFYITTPIYYPSGSLHIGHVYTTTLTWVLKNYKEMDGYDAKWLTGADEHGQKIQQKAEDKGITPQEYADGVVKTFQELWDLLGIKPDYFSRTTSPKHKKAVAKQFEKFLEQGDIYKGKYKGLYSVSDEEFLTPTQAEEKDGKYYHPTSGHELQEVEEESYFFKMSKFQDWLIDYIKADPNFITPKKTVVELMNNFLEKGLEDLSVTRSSFSWGIKIPSDSKHVMYVWMDALNNYITALGYNSEDDSDYKKYWVDGDEVVHVVGKEITRFHGIYWPIFLKAAGLRIPNRILSHGWIITPTGKMSKSKGNTIDPIELVNKFGSEEVKYFFASQSKFGSDFTFEEERLKEVYNADLANNYGNLLSRTIAMTKQNFDGAIRHVEPTTKDDKQIIKDITTHFASYKENFDKYDINNAFSEMVVLSKKLNGYIDVTKPWTLKEDKVRLEEVLSNLLNGIYAVTTMLSVVMPNKTTEALKQLNLKKLSFDLVNDFNKFDNVIVEKGPVLFERIK